MASMVLRTGEDTFISRASAMTEAQLLASVLKLAHLFRWEPYHTHDSRRSNPGFPDLVLAKVNRLVIYAELKDDDGEVTEDQEKWLAILRTTPSQVFVWRPDDLQEIARILGASPLPPPRKPAFPPRPFS